MTPRKASSLPDDPATQYAVDVRDGRIVAGPHVRNACRRHLRDLDRQGTPEFPYTWHTELVDGEYGIVSFFRRALTLNGGEHEGKPFVPEPWQAFVLGSLFGWVGEDGYRRFRLAFIETGKGSGKSPLAAGVGIKMLMADDEPRAEVYAAAVDKDQAGVLFRDAVAMAKGSPAIDGRVVYSGGEGKEWNIAYVDTGSFFRPVSSDSAGRGKSGFRPHGVLLDEIHEHPTNAMVEFLRAGTKGRRQALIFMITNSGVDRSSVCFDYHQVGIKVAAGDQVDESFFSYICALDEDDDPLNPETGRDCWIKANPSLGVTFPEKYLEEQVTAARGMPSKESIVRRLNFCQWVDAANPWISGDLWRACEVEGDEWDAAALRGRPCFLALDLSVSTDLTAGGLVWPDGEGGADAEVFFWTPQDTLSQREGRDRVPYTAWVRDGHMAAVPGRYIDYGFIAKWIAEIDGLYELEALAFDPHKMPHLIREFSEVGLNAWLWEGPDSRPQTGLRLVRHGQGFGGGASDKSLWMPRSVEVLEQMVMSGKLRVRKNPALTHNSASAVLEQDAAGNKKWEKRKSTGRIDGIVALCMSAGLAFEQGGKKRRRPPRVWAC